MRPRPRGGRIAAITLGPFVLEARIGRGDGTNKHNAGQAAARAALAAMQAGVDACG